MPDIFYELNKVPKKERIDVLVSKIAIILFVLIQIPIFFVFAAGDKSSVIFAIVVEIAIITGLIFIYFQKITLALFLISLVFYAIFAIIPYVYNGYHLTVAVAMSIFIFNTYIFEKKQLRHINLIALVVALVLHYIALYSYYPTFLGFVIGSSTAIISLIIMYIVIEFFKKDVEKYEQKLYDANNFLTQITDLNPHFIYAKNNDDKFVFTNKTMAEFYGHLPDEMIGQKVDKFYESNEKLERTTDIGIIKNESNQLLVSTIGNNGELTYHEVIHTPMLDKNGESKITLGVAINITESKKAEIALQESEQRYKQLYQSNQMGIVSVKKGRFSTVNDKFCAMTGYTKAEIIGEKIVGIMHPTDYEATLEKTKRVDTGESKGEVFEHRFIRKDGTIGHALLHHQLLTIGGESLEATATLTDISELKAIEQALRKSETIYRKLIENAFDGIEIHESTPPKKDGDKWQHKLLVRNDRIYAILGKTKHKVKHTSFSMDDILAMSPEFQANGKKSKEYIREIQRELQKNGVVNFEWIYGKDEQGRYTEMTIIEFDFEGKKYITAIYKDITEEKKAEIALRESEAMYRHLFENAFDGIEIYEFFPDTGRTGKLLQRNGKLRQLFGRTDRELKDEDKISMLELSPKIQPNGMESADMLKTVQKEFRKHNQADIEWRFTHAQNHFVDVQLSVHTYNVAEKHIYMGIYKDITEKKKTEIAMRESEVLYRHLFENAFDGIEIYEYDKAVGAKSNLFARNDKLRFLLGRTDKEIDEEKGTSTLRISPEIQPNGRKSAEYLTEKQAEFGKNKIAAFEWQFTHKNGKPVDVYLILKEYHINNKVILTGIYKDITDRKKTEKIIQQNLEQLQQKNQELQKFIESNMQLENFAYLASHDLKEPIRTIVSFSQLLKRSAEHKLSEAEREYINFVIEGSKNMSMLIEDLLAYSRVDTEDKTIQNIRVEDMLYTVNYELNTLIKSKNATINTENLPENINADKVQIRQLFQNLITNAIRYSSPERPPIVRISAQEQEQEWLFKVSDNGIGIKSEFYERIFLLFRKLHNERDKGTGIGLALCKKIVENHGGRIWVESEEGKGSDFYFTINKNLVFGK